MVLTQRSVVLALLSVFFCFFATDATFMGLKADSRKTQQLAMRVAGSGADNTHGDLTSKDESKQGDNNDDDDDDDDDDDEETAAAPAAAPKPAPAPLANPHAAEEGRLKAAVFKVEQELAANLAKQAELKHKVKYLSDSSKSSGEIDASSKSVANETESIAMATMLGKMWKEMRMFELPMYTEHVNKELRELKHSERRTEAKLVAAQAKLAAARRTWAENVGKKMKVAKEEDEAKEVIQKKDDSKKQDEDEDAGKEAPAETKDGVLPVPPVTATTKVAGASAEDRFLHNYSFWYMSPGQRKAVMMSTLIYLVFGIVIAFLYKQARTRYATAFEPRPRPGPASLQYPQKDFSSSLFDCFGDPNICVVGCCCPFLRWADTTDQKGLLSYWKAFFIMFSLMLLHVYTAGLTSIVAIMVGVYYRQKLRRKYGIDAGTGGSIFMDVLSWMCCQPCAIIQEAREDAVQQPSA